MDLIGILKTSVPIFFCHNTAVRQHIKLTYNLPADKEDVMLKIRLQGTTNDIKWFLKILKKDNRFIANEPSDIMAIKGTKRYKRAYTELFRDLSDFRTYNNRLKKDEKPTIVRHYYGSGSTFDYSNKRK